MRDLCKSALVLVAEVTNYRTMSCTMYSMSRMPYVVDLVKNYVADMIVKFWSPADQQSGGLHSTEVAFFLLNTAALHSNPSVPKNIPEENY